MKRGCSKEPAGTSEAEVEGFSNVIATTTVCASSSCNKAMVEFLLLIYGFNQVYNLYNIRFEFFFFEKRAFLPGVGDRADF